MHVEILGGTVEIDESHVEESPTEIRRQLREYEHDERQTFDLSIEIPETFTGAVMEQLLTIPYGETRTYGEIAAALDTAPVAVGGACGRNLVTVVVPCHRVLRSGGELGGYSAPGGVDLKRRLLDHESNGV
ncbi:methylated-DNA--protein-cysteine methyltransferase [Halococcus morrhuae DSM 1307]|uniref:Methylated-DNA--protein-cysteine methyltransferase n=2 Tax=Halococcus TaxID=2249 RepID=M0MDR0_HALMO|nr:methylated-DNA--[protein]-cysteine S-methyltransferase [Halococcus morrhuae]EMA43463.1 methylated-DNA--protein-cysteine methyltransferase [Halococcus morrhuae DSM 1307]